MNAKKIVGFLVMKPAFTQRNLTSMMLVAVFIGTYMLMGGKITTEVPGPGRKGTFGGGAAAPADISLKDDAKPTADEAAAAAKDLGTADPKELLGEVPTAEYKQRQRAILGKTEFSEEEREAGEEELNKEGLIDSADFSNRRKEWKLQRNEKKQIDSLSAIEERLKIKRSGK